MMEPLVKTIEVPCGRDQAFSVFLDLGSWWPLGKFATSVMRGQTVKAVQVDPREGGRIVEIASDGEETLWGTITTYTPPEFLKLAFHIPHPSEQSPGFTTVEVRFTSLAEMRTRVDLTQSNWEGLGPSAGRAAGGYRQAWDMILGGGYLPACSRH